MRIGHLTRKAATLGVGRGTVVLAQFAINLVLVRWWMPEEFGRFHQIRLLLTLAALLDLGLPIGLLQASGGMTPHQRDDLFRRGISFSLVLGILAGVGFVCVGLILPDQAIAHALPAAGLLIAATIPAAALESVLVVQERHLRASIIGAAAALGGLAASSLVLFRHPTVDAVYLCLALAGVSRLVALWKWSGVPWQVLCAWPSAIWPLLRTSFAASANRLLAMLSASVDRAVVALLFSAGTLGWYVTGAWEVPFMSVFFGAIVSTILPEMSEHWAAGRTQDFLAVWHAAIRRTAWIVFPLWLWVWVWAPELLQLLFTSRFEDGLPVFRVYLLVLPLRVAVYSVLFLAMNETRLLLWGAALDLTLNVCLSVALAALIGPIGPAVATTTATWVQTLYYLIVLARPLKMPVSRLLPWGALCRALATASVAVLPTIAVRSWVQGDALRLLVALIGTVGVLGVFMIRRASGTSSGRSRETDL